VAIFYQALTPTQITNLFQAAGNVYVPVVAGFSGTPTNVFVTQTVTFTDGSTGGTNWFWNFGDGNTLNAQTTGASHAYTTPGTYTVSQTVTGPGGTAALTNTAYIVALPIPAIGSAKMSGGSFILSGASGIAGAQYRVLSSTNVALPVASWTPVWTNVYAADGSYSYTNSSPTNSPGFYILVSP
jgi:PKD repeat protein